MSGPEQYWAALPLPLLSRWLVTVAQARLGAEAAALTARPRRRPRCPA